MANIAQKNCFGWEEIDELGDLERLVLVLEHIPDEKLMRHLEEDRGNGRDRYPIRPMWNSLIALVIYQHDGVDSLRRELSRNAQLRQVCGFNTATGAGAVPPSYVYSRFLRSLKRRMKEVEEIFEELVKQLCRELPEFGKKLAMDSKELHTYAQPHKEQAERKKPDGRREDDADFGKKEYHGVREDGSPWEKIKKWFGYKLHLIVDATYELPVTWKLTRASRSDSPEAHELVAHLKEHQEEILTRCEDMMADRGYDDGKLIEKLWDIHGIHPVIDIRNMWKDGEATRMLSRAENVVYDYCGTISCYCPVSGEVREMTYAGFEHDRMTLKYRCPASHYGFTCKGMHECPVKGSIRIPLAEDRRIFTPLARSSYKWKETYKKRTSVERVNSRIDGPFGFEHHFIRGMKKMQLRCGVALCIMLAMALGKIKTNRQDEMRCLVTNSA